MGQGLLLLHVQMSLGYQRALEEVANKDQASEAVEAAAADSTVAAAEVPETFFAAAAYWSVS